MSRSTSYRLEEEGYLSRPMRISPGIVRWKLTAIEAIESQAAADAGEAKP